MALEKIHPLDPGEGSKILIAAGVLKRASHLTPFFDIEDPEAMPTLTVGSAIHSPWPGNAATHGGEDFTYDFKRLAAGNCRGLPGGGIEELSELAKPVRILREMGCRVIVSVSNLPAESPLEVVPELTERVIEIVAPTAVEINLSCPNGRLPDGSFHPPVCTNAEVSAELLHKTRLVVGGDTCLGIKDSAHVSSLEDDMNEGQIVQLAQAVSPYIDFVTGINTIGNQPFPELSAGGGRGGMSGPIVAEVAKRWLGVWAQHSPERIAKLSCGGVDSANVSHEFAERRELGALLVGGAQEFYRARNPAELALRWTIATA